MTSWRNSSRLSNGLVPVFRSLGTVLPRSKAAVEATWFKLLMKSLRNLGGTIVHRRRANPREGNGSTTWQQKIGKTRQSSNCWATACWCSEEYFGARYDKPSTNTGPYAAFRSVLVVFRKLSNASSSDTKFQPDPLKLVLERLFISPFGCFWITDGMARCDLQEPFSNFYLDNVILLKLASRARDCWKGLHRCEKFRRKWFLIWFGPL